MDRHLSCTGGPGWVEGGQRREEEGRKTREVDDEEMWETAVSTSTTGSGLSNTWTAPYPQKINSSLPFFQISVVGLQY